MRTLIRLVLALGLLLAVLHGLLWAQPACDPYDPSTYGACAPSTPSTCDPYADPRSCPSPTTPPWPSPYDPPAPDWPAWLHCQDARVVAAGVDWLCAYTGPFEPYRDPLIRHRPMCDPFTVGAGCRVPTGTRPAILWTHTAYRTAEGVEVRVVGQVYTRTAEIVYIVWWWVPRQLGQYGVWPRSAGPEPLCAGAGAVAGCR